jgi:hypothetical protein
MQTALCNSRNAVSVSSACTTKRFQSPRLRINNPDCSPVAIDGPLTPSEFSGAVFERLKSFHELLPALLEIDIYNWRFHFCLCMHGEFRMIRSNRADSFVLTVNIESIREETIQACGVNPRSVGSLLRKLRADQYHFDRGSYGCVWI